MSSRLTKKSLVSTPAVGEHAVLAAAVVGAECTQTADQHRQLRAVTPIRYAFSSSSCSSGSFSPAGLVAEPVRPRFEHRERLHIGFLLGGVSAARRERHGHLDAAILGGLLDRRVAGQHDDIG